MRHKLNMLYNQVHVKYKNGSPKKMLRVLVNLQDIHEEWTSKFVEKPMKLFSSILH